jgi:hypothetical protein
VTTVRMTGHVLGVPQELVPVTAEPAPEVELERRLRLALEDPELSPADRARVQRALTAYQAA